MAVVKLAKAVGAMQVEAEIVSNSTSKHIVLQRQPKILDSDCPPGVHKLWLGFSAPGSIFVELEGATWDGLPFIDDTIPSDNMAWEYTITVE